MPLFISKKPYPNRLIEHPHRLGCLPAHRCDNSDNICCLCTMLAVGDNNQVNGNTRPHPAHWRLESSPFTTLPMNTRAWSVV